MDLYAAQVLRDEPVGYWRLGELSGSTAADSSGNGRAMALGAGYTRGLAGAIASTNDAALLLNGTTGHGTIADAATWDVANLTLEAWIKTTSSGLGQILCRDTGSDRVFQWRYLVGVYDVLIFDSGGSFVQYLSAVNVGDGNWHHMAVTFDGARVRSYVDGVVDLDTARTTPIQNASAAAIECGSFANANGYFDGMIDEVAFYGTALSAARIKAHYTSGRYGRVGRILAPNGGRVLKAVA